MVYKLSSQSLSIHIYQWRRLKKCYLRLPEVLMEMFYVVFYAMLCCSVLFCPVLQVVQRWENGIIYHLNQDTIDIPQSQSEIELCKSIDLLKCLKDHRGRWDVIHFFLSEFGNKNSTAAKEHFICIYVSTSASPAHTDWEPCVELPFRGLLC